MATLTGNDGAISINGIAVLAVRNYSIDMTADTIETTTMQSDQRTYVAGLSSFSGSADVYFDNTDYDTNESSFNPTASAVGASGVAGKFYIAKDIGGSSGDSVFQGSLIITGYTVNSSMDGMVEASISFQGTGAVTYSTGTNVSYP
jgi:predicted secreted protein